MENYARITKQGNLYYVLVHGNCQFVSSTIKAAIDHCKSNSLEYDTQDPLLMKDSVYVK